MRLETWDGSAPVKVGIIGAGVISDRYLSNAKRFPGLKIVAIADIDPARSRVRAEQHDVAPASVEGLLADPDIEVVVNLTVPSVHAEVNRAAILAGKHVYSEKPLATDRAAGAELLALADQRGLLVGCAPDTFLGAGLQTARSVLDAGVIGTPIAATAFMVGFGPERWHPDPAFFYAPGAGPLFDVGPYYLTMLVHLFGPIAAVNAHAVIGRATRPIFSEPRRGQLIDVTTAQPRP
jgi:predicted dehydrogenase